MSNRSRGFTLLEMVVALAVLSLMLGTVYVNHADNLLQARLRLARTQALAVAQSIVDDVTTSGVVAATSGQHGAFTWRVDMEVQVDEAPSHASPSTFRVSVTRQDDIRSQVSLSAAIPLDAEPR